MTIGKNFGSWVRVDDFLPAFNGNFICQVEYPRGQTELLMRYEDGNWRAQEVAEEGLKVVTWYKHEAINALQSALKFGESDFYLDFGFEVLLLVEALIGKQVSIETLLSVYNNKEILRDLAPIHCDIQIEESVRKFLDYDQTYFHTVITQANVVLCEHLRQFETLP